MADVEQTEVSPPLSVDERVARGKQARREVPRSSHAEWAPTPDRADPVALLEEQARNRDPDLVPIRYGRMLVSPYTFYRGGAYIMAADLAPGPRTSLDVQLCGDAHLANFGMYTAPDRRPLISVNDFDETHVGPFEWDVKRLVASFEVAARDRGFAPREREAIDRTVSLSYRNAMAEFASMRTLDVWYARMDTERSADFTAQLSAKALDTARRNYAKAGRKTSLGALAKLTETVDGQLRIKNNPPVLVPVEVLAGPDGADAANEAVLETLRLYQASVPDSHRLLLERFRYVHAARKVVGVGSVGTRAWVVLLTGRDGGDPLFLQVKEAQASVLEPFVGASTYPNHGQRVVEGQQVMQSASDIMLGWTHSPGWDGVRRDYYVRQLWDGKLSAQVETFSPRTMTAYASGCGWVLALAHARSGDPVAISSYLGSSDTFDRALAAFGASYADQNQRDYTALQTAANEERIPVVSGV